MIRGVLTDRVKGVAGLMDGLGPVAGGILDPEKFHVRPVGGDFLRGQVVKFKDILDKFLFLVVDGALFASASTMRRMSSSLTWSSASLGSMPKSRSTPLVGDGQKPYDGSEQLGDAAYQAGDGEA